MAAGSKGQRSSSKAGRAMPQAEASEIRYLAVPVSAPPAGSYCSKAEKEHLVRGVLNSLHDEYLVKLGIFPTKKGAVAQELFVDFPQCKQQEASQQFEAAEAATEHETIDTSVPPSELQSQKRKGGEQDVRMVRDAESLKATKLFRMLQRLASDPVELEDLAQVPHSMSQESQPHSLAASIWACVVLQLPDRAGKLALFFTTKVERNLLRRPDLTRLTPEMGMLVWRDEAPLVFLKQPWRSSLLLQRQRLPLLRCTAESCCLGPTQGLSGGAPRGVTLGLGAPKSSRRSSETFATVFYCLMRLSGDYHFAMQKRICLMIGERIPLELLTRHAISPPQLAEIQVLLYSKPVAILAFAFCHLLHWLSFGQTSRDRPQFTALADLNGGSSNTTGSRTLASASAFSSGDQVKASLEAHEQDSQVKGRPGRPNLRSSSAADLREQKLLSRGQEILDKGAEPYQRSTSARCLGPQGPEKQLAKNLLHFSKQKFSECDSLGSRSWSSDSRPAPPQSDGEVNAPEHQRASQDLGELEIPLNSCDRRLKALALAEILYKQIVRKIRTTFGAFGVAFVCPLMVLALKEATAWAIRQQMPKFFKQSLFHFELADRINALFSQLFDPQAYFVRFPAIEAHPLTQQLQKKLEKYLTNCPKPPVSASECFQAICSPLDLSGCTEVLQRQLQQLHKEVEQRSSLLQLGQTKTSTPSEMSHKDTDPQYRLLRLQQEKHELLERQNPRAFEPISNWACPG
ncbi:hypothetical protein Emag_006752 [Eimeria magna]